ncbi:transport protein SEC23 A-like protein [Drosera capensis]
MAASLPKSSDSLPPPPPFASPSRLMMMQQQQQQPDQNQVQYQSPSLTKTPTSWSPTPTSGIGSSSSGSSPVPHMSVPPGPPLFSSPLRPAAVPFRTSPASPAQLADSGPASSSSSLPVSSPPNNSNGSSLEQQLHHQVSDETSEIRGAPQVLFSAHTILKYKKQVNVPSLGLGVLVSLGTEILPGPQIVQHEAHRCGNCGAYPNLFCNLLTGSGQWQCVICRNLNGSEGEYVASSIEELRRLPELSFPLVDYVRSGTRRPGFVPASDSRMSAPIILLIDACIDEPHLQHLQSSLHAFIDSLSPTTRIGIISYSRTVSVYDFSEESVASADVLVGDKSPDEETLKALIYGTGLYMPPIHASLPVAHAICSSLRPYMSNVPENLRERCIGTAVEVALAIIRGPSAEVSRGVVKRAGGNSRVIVCAAGPNTCGPGSVPHSQSHPNYPYLERTALKWMEHLGQEAHRQHTVVDILCAGTCPVRVPILQPLAKASGGVLILHDDFGDAFGVIGPGKEALVDMHESFKNDLVVSVQMLSVEETQSFAVFMETKRDIRSDFVYFQFAIQFSNVYLADVSRVTTIRLPAVDSVSAYLDSVQDEVAAVLVAKRTLLRAKGPSDAIAMRATIDERVKDIAMKFGSQVPKSKLYRFPKELPLLPELFFHLRRGPLLGNIVGHEDERSVLRSLFLNAAFDLSLRMIAPRCLMHREGGAFEELPAYDLSMQSDAAVVLDHGTDVFIWLGAVLAVQERKRAAALAACRTLAEEITESRFPAPLILAFKEGSSQARYFVSRLIPAHKDPPYEQEARFPQLRSLTVDQRTKLKSSFLPLDEPSFCEWMHSLKLVPPEP